MTFHKEQIYCILDWETYSEANLKTVGAFEYSMHPSTEIICAAWRIGTRETLRHAKTRTWAPELKYEPSEFGSLFQALMDPNIMLVAHNALFEQVIVRNVFAEKHMYSKKGDLQAIKPDRWICTASLASALAIPRSLEAAAKVLRLRVQKDMEGSKLIKKWCKPKKASKKDPRIRYDDIEELRRIVSYCATDVDTEVELFLKARPLTPNERRIWILDQNINLRGFEVDRKLVNRVLGLIEQETEYIDAQTELMSMGAIRSATQRVPVMNWLENLGVFLPNLQKKTVEDALATDLAGETNEYTKREDAEQAKRLLQYRLDISKSSTKKYTAFEERSRTDSRLRDILIYHTASTGRWGGAGVQPQNFPRGSIKDSIQASRLVMREDLEMIRMIYGSPMAVFSSIIRNMIVAPKGQTLDVADYAAIEARVLFWVANHEEGLQAFREDRDLYKEQAMDIYRIKDIDLIDSTKRFLGKSAILGAGYAMGAKKFQATCAQQGEVVSLELADTAIKSYRKKHWPVVKLWGNIEKAAISAVQRPGKKITVNHTSWFLSKDNFLFCELPSGRRIAYATPTVKFEPTPWGEKRPVLYHWGVDPTTKQWVEAKTYGGKLVENVVQAIARDLMAEAMLRIDAVGWSRIVLTVHDELVAERTLFGEGSNEEFCRLMAETPEWAKGLPVKVEGFESARYRK